MMNVSDQNIKNVIDDIPTEDQGGDSGVGNSEILENGMKECKACTFHNEPTNSRCEMCDSCI